MTGKWLSRLLPRAKDRLAVGVGGALISTLLMLGRGVPAWTAWDASARLSAAGSRRELTITQAAIHAHHSGLSMRATLARQLDSLSGAYLSAPSAAIAGAALATLISDLAAENGIRVTSVSVRPDSAARTAFTRIAARMSATGDTEGLSNYLAAIESSEQLLAVRELSISQTDPAAPDSRAEVLRFEVLVEGLVRIDSRGRPITTSHERIALSTAAKP